jgi:hypothetical protein
LEASTKGTILIITATEIKYHAKAKLSTSPAICGTLGGIGGGVAQAYLTMGIATRMKTVEVTRRKLSVNGAKVPGIFEIFKIFREQGFRGVNKGINASVLRQITGWSLRIGIARLQKSVFIG